jgi:ribosomal protein S18 acetylase RimI-like enzyme
VSIKLRGASNADRFFIESIYFDTQRWLIEELFGKRGDKVERQKFAEFYDQANTSIIVVNGEAAGWITVARSPEGIHLEQIYLAASWQNRGFGSLLVGQLVDEARAAHVPLRLSTAKNPAKSLYERLGFIVLHEDRYKLYMELR